MRYSHGDKTKYFKVCHECKKNKKKQNPTRWRQKSSLRVRMTSCCFNCPAVASQCNQPNCPSTFKKRRMFKLHLKEHHVAAKFKCVCSKPRRLCAGGCALTRSFFFCSFFLLFSCAASRCVKEGCGATFDSHVARKAHEKKHAGWSHRLRPRECVSPLNGPECIWHESQPFFLSLSAFPRPLALTGYCCPRANCQVVEHTWGKLRKHMAKHQGEGLVCKLYN